MTKVHAALKLAGTWRLSNIAPKIREVAIKPVHKMSERQMRREMEAAGFRHVKTVRTLPLQHLIVFEIRGMSAASLPRGAGWE